MQKYCEGADRQGVLLRECKINKYLGLYKCHSALARVRHCMNPAKDREMAPTKCIQGPLWPFPFLIA